MSTRGRIGAIVYWIVAVLLTGVGFIDLAGIGAPFLLVGLAMMALWPFRRKARTYWSAMVGVFAFIGGYVLAAPLGCTTTQTTQGGVSTTTCTNILRLDYSGAGVYNPSLFPALVAGLATGVLLAAAVWFLLRRRATHT